MKYKNNKKIHREAFNNKLQFSHKYLDINNSSTGQCKVMTMVPLAKFPFPPLKFKYIRTNYSKLMTNELSIMLRTKLRKQFFKKNISKAKAYRTLAFAIFFSSF